VVDRARAEKLLDGEEACGWNSYREGDHQMEHTILRPRTDVALAAEFAAVRKDERKAFMEEHEADQRQLLAQQARIATLEAALREVLDANLRGLKSHPDAQRTAEILGRARAALAPCVVQTPDHDDELPVKEDR